MGYRKLDVVNNLPDNHKITTPNDPYPISIFGESKTIPDNKIGKYINEEFNFYLNIYENNKLFGFPYKDWTEYPKWLIQLHKMFSQIEIEYQNYQINKQYSTN
jgi:hypothetical protein